MSRPYLTIAEEWLDAQFERRSYESKDVIDLAALIEREVAKVTRKRRASYCTHGSLCRNRKECEALSKRITKRSLATSWFMYVIVRGGDGCARTFWNGRMFVPAARVAKVYESHPRATDEARTIGQGARVESMQCEVRP